MAEEFEVRFYLVDTIFQDPASLLSALDGRFGTEKIKDYAFRDTYFRRIDTQLTPKQLSGNPRIRYRTVWTGKPPATLIVTKAPNQEKVIVFEGTLEDYDSAVQRLRGEGYEPVFDVEKTNGLHYRIRTTPDTTVKRRIAFEGITCRAGERIVDIGTMGELEVSGTTDAAVVRAAQEEIAASMGLSPTKLITEPMAVIAAQRLGLL